MTTPALEPTTESTGTAASAADCSKSRWGWLHWVLCLLPFALIIAIQFMDVQRYWWLPFAAIAACPIGMWLMMRQMNGGGMR